MIFIVNVKRTAGAAGGGDLGRAGFGAGSTSKQSGRRPNPSGQSSLEFIRFRAGRRQPGVDTTNPRSPSPTEPERMSLVRERCGFVRKWDRRPRLESADASIAGGQENDRK